MPIAKREYNLWSDFTRLFFPPACAGCGKAVTEGAGFMCPACRLDIPLTYTWEMGENPVKEKFAGRLIVENACAFFYYVHGSRYRDLIHDFKYAGSWKTARQMGLWFGSCLAESGLYGTVDLVMPVPLHRRKLLKRGYNQAEYIAEGIAAALSTDISAGNLVRRRHGKSQTKVEGGERWDNIRGAFHVRRPGELEGRHILLVDDVLTTGATLTACGETILRSTDNTTLSIAALATAK
ncbi:MAG: ComF family protein [Rikenellaceae bacterium]|nr:ComF family protein [Rikenellaceae bacterium]